MRKRTLLVVFLSLFSTSVPAVTGPFTKKVAFGSDRDGNPEIYAMNANGTSQARLTNNAAADTQPAFARSGKIAFTSDRDGNNEIYVMDASGANQTRITNNPASDSQPSWSPDGSKIVFLSTRGGGFDIFLMNADGSGVTQLTNDPGFDLDPVFSPAGNKIFFISTRDGNHEVYSMNLDGSAQTRITNNTLFELRPDVSPDGTKVAVARNVPGDGPGLSQQIVIMSAGGGNETILSGPGANGNPAFSADGQRIFFSSSRDLNQEIYSMKVNGSNQVRLTNLASSDTAPSIQSVLEAETVGVYRPTTGEWILDLQTVTGPDQAPLVDITVTFGGQPGDLPLSGDWNADGRSDIGVFRDGTFHLALLKAAPVVGTLVETITPFNFGQAGDRPVAGDWDGDGKDEVGLFRPGATGSFLIRRQVSVNGHPGFLTIVFSFGTTGDLPVAGDWNGDGIDTPGVFRPGETGAFLLTNSFANSVDFNFAFGTSDSLPVAGDWIAAGRDGVGIFIPTTSAFLLTQELFPKGGFVASHGQPGDLPVAGSWP